MRGDESRLLLIPKAAAELISKSGPWGHITCRVSEPDRAAIVMAVSEGNSLPQRMDENKTHFLTSGDTHPLGVWYRTTAELAVQAYLLIRQQQALTFKAFKKYVPEARDPGAGQYIAITFTEAPPEIAPGRVLPQFTAWTVSRDGAQPENCDVETDRGQLSTLAAHWPIRELKGQRVLLIGAGSIGGAAAVALSGYGVGNLDIVDPDRLLYHNIPRHICSSSAVGRYKVDALAKHIGPKWTETDVSGFRIDAIADADLLRPLIDMANVVVCTVDGVEPRRVISYLCKRAGRPLVLACVLADGRYGEILRLRPFPEIGCLECQRRALHASGQMDLEPTLDRGYGEGTRHNPMTAVGADLHLMGSLAAKAAVATILNDLGHLDQVLEDDNAVVALRPEAGLAKPFDSARAMSIGWYPSAASYPDCLACRPA